MSLRKEKPNNKTKPASERALEQKPNTNKNQNEANPRKHLWVGNLPGLESFVILSGPHSLAFGLFIVYKHLQMVRENKETKNSPKPHGLKEAWSQK